MRGWTKKQVARAEGIVNDIAEQVDGGEDRRILREALAIYADKVMEAGIREVKLKDELFWRKQGLKSPR